MTGIAPPPAATNKDTTVITGGSNSTVPLLPSVDIAMSANIDPSNLLTNVENILRTQHESLIANPRTTSPPPT
jgi:hypothetical protein